MTPYRRASTGIIAALLICAGTGRARAESTPQQAAAAESLFKEALDLMNAGQFEGACPRLEKSQELDPGTGTRLNLALCFEAIGKTASAWSQFNLVIGEAKRSTPPRMDRVKTAQEHADALAPKLSYLKVTLPEEGRVGGTRVKIDGQDAPSDLAIPVDPGDRVVEVTAPERKAWRTDVRVPARGGSESVAAPVLEPLSVETPGPPPAPVAPPAAASAPSSSRTGAYVAFSVGAAAITTGAVFGVLAVLKDNESRRCGADPACTSDPGVEGARRDAWVANVAIPVGVIGVGVGIALLYLSPAPRRGSVGVAPVHGGAAAAWVQRW